MKRLDRFFFFNLLNLTGVSVLFSLLIMLALQAARLSELLVHTDADLAIVIKMFQGLSLSFTPLIIPLAFLFSSLALFGRLSTDRELVALQSMGYGPWRLMRPCFWVGGALSLITLLCAFVLAPFGNRLFEKAIDETYSKKAASVLQAGTFTEGFLDGVLYVQDKLPGGRFSKAFLYDNSTMKNEVVLSAKEAQWNPPGTNGWAQLQFFNGMMVSKKLEENLVQRIRFDECTINADFRYAEGKSRDSMESQDLGGLLYKRSHPAAKSEDQRLLWIEIARRVWVSFSFFFFIPLCFLSSLSNQRTAQSRVVLTGVIIGFVYWGVYFSLVSWAAKNPLPFFNSELVMWFVVCVPNLIIGLIAAYYMKLRFGKLFPR